MFTDVRGRHDFIRKHLKDLGAKKRLEPATGLINESRHDAQQCFLNQLNTAPHINDSSSRAKNNRGSAEDSAL